MLIINGLIKYQLGANIVFKMVTKHLMVASGTLQKNINGKIVNPPDLGISKFMKVILEWLVLTLEFILILNTDKMFCLELSLMATIAFSLWLFKNILIMVVLVDTK